MRRTLFLVLGSLGSASLASLLALGCSPVGATTVSSPGQNASAFLTSSSTSMVIEVAPMAGEDPDPSALQLLLARANEHCNKPGGIQIVIDPDVPNTPPPPGQQRVHTLDDLIAFSSANRKVQGAPGQAVLFIEYVDGVLASPPNVLGASFGPTSIAIFKDQLRSAFGPEESALEGRVLVHEMGHELGLVNEGIPMLVPHEDLAHRGHCSNPNCVMFWTLHGAVSADAPLPPDDYDSQCIADLQAAGGR